jgi:hypothetical protein
MREVLPAKDILTEAQLTAVSLRSDSIGISLVAHAWGYCVGLGACRGLSSSGNNPLGSHGDRLAPVGACGFDARCGARGIVQIASLIADFEPMVLCLAYVGGLRGLSPLSLTASHADVAPRRSGRRLNGPLPDKSGEFAA